jgi:hypothetical protein
LLAEIAQSHARLARRLAVKRPLLTHAIAGRLAPLERALANEEDNLRAADRVYWLPLLKELERLRLAK